MQNIMAMSQLVEKPRPEGLDTFGKPCRFKWKNVMHVKLLAFDLVTKRAFDNQQG